MTGFGDKLRREREMRGVSLEEISESTKIGTRSLRALEEGDFDKLPGGIFNKGFVRAYSRFLGLDEEQTVADFDTALKEHRLASGHVEEVPIEDEPEPASSQGLVLIAIVVVLIAAVAFGAYRLRVRRSQFDSASDQSKIGNAPIAATTDAAPAISPSPQESTAKAAANPTSPSAEIKATNSEASKSSPNSSGTAKSVEGSAARTESSEASSNASPPIRLEVFAKEQSWLSVSADGKSLGQQLLEAQETRTIRAQKEVRLRVGNVGGVEVSFNGKPVNIDGEPKQVKELTFTPDGLHQ